jgi:hypothetical protein
MACMHDAHRRARRSSAVCYTRLCGLTSVMGHAEDTSVARKLEGLYTWLMRIDPCARGSAKDALAGKGSAFQHASGGLATCDRDGAVQVPVAEGCHITLKGGLPHPRVAGFVHDPGGADGFGNVQHPPVQVGGLVQPRGLLPPCPVMPSMHTGVPAQRARTQAGRSRLHTRCQCARHPLEVCILARGPLTKLALAMHCTLPWPCM